jgi:DNA topoisomerase-3
MFHCKGLAITAYNFLEIYRYEKWSDKTIPNFKKGEQYLPSVLEMYHDKTNAPSCLTESELIQLMYDNGIGKFLAKKANLELGSGDLNLKLAF